MRLNTLSRALIVAAVAAGAVTTAASATVFADYNLHPPCCGGAALLGSRVSIKTPSSAFTMQQQCAGFRVESQAADPDPRLIQTGFVNCSPDNNVDGTCATMNRQVKYVEVVDASDVHTCTPAGIAGTAENHKYSVQKTSNDWRAFIDGVATGGSVWFTWDLILEGAEYSGVCSDTFSIPSPGVIYGSTQVWQRYDGSAWVNVSTAYTPGNICGWVLSGGPSGQWNEYHP